MIARMEVGGLDDFRKVGEYLEHGSAQNNNYTPDPSTRVGHTSTRNLFAESRAEIVGEMTATARTTRADKPALHLIVSWERGDELRGVEPDNPTPQEMDEVVDRLMEALDLEEHHAWIVEHIDTDTPHLHALINGVHPEIQRAWESSYSKKQIFETARQLEKEYGWHPATDKSLKEIWENNQLKNTYWERNWEELGRDAPFIVKVRAVTTPIFEGTTSWPDLVGRLEKLGLRLEPRYDRGMVLTNGREGTSLSRIHPKFSRPRLEERFQMSWTVYRELVRQGLSREEIEARAGRSSMEPSSAEQASAEPSSAEQSGMEPSNMEGAAEANEDPAPVEAAQEAQAAGDGQTGAPPPPTETNRGAGRPAERLTPHIQEGAPPEGRAGEDVSPHLTPSRDERASDKTDTDKPLLAGGSTPPGGGTWEDYLTRLTVENRSSRPTQPGGLLGVTSRQGPALGRLASTTAYTAQHVMNERTGYDPPPIASGDMEVKEALAFADRYFKEQYEALEEDHPAKRYVRERLGEPGSDGVEFAVEAGVGYAPDDWNDFTDAAEEAGVSPDALVRAGLAVERKDGSGYFSTFRGRMMFAMTDYDGTVRGFGGRRIEGMERSTPTLDGFPKYINSREGGLFDKKEVLFGVSEARQMRGPVFVTEGYLDALQMQRAGFRSVALAGTRMSEQHAAQVNAMLAPSEAPVVMLDGDEAGVSNTDEVVVQLVEGGTRPRVVQLPDGMDADTFVRDRGAEGVRRYHGRHAERWSDYVYNRIVGQEAFGESPIARRDAYERMLGVLQRAPSERSRERLFLDAYSAMTDQSLPVTPEMDPSVEGRFEAYRESYETSMREAGVDVRAWAEARADYPELRGEPVGPARPAANQMGDGAENARPDIAEPDSAPRQEQLYTPLRQIQKAIEEGEEPPELANLAMEWRALQGEAEGLQERYRVLQDAWEEALIASFKDPDQAIRAHAKNQAYHNPVFARRAVIYPENYRGAFAPAPPFKESVNAERQRKALLDIHEKMTKVEGRMATVTKYADEIAQTFTEENVRSTREERERAAQEAEARRAAAGQQQEAQSPEGQQQEGQQQGAQQPEGKTGGAQEDETNLDTTNQPEPNNESARDGAAGRDSEPGRAGDGDPLANRPFAPPAEGEEGRVYAGEGSGQDRGPETGGAGTRSAAGNDRGDGRAGSGEARGGAEKAETEEPAKSDEEKVAESKDIMEEVYKGLNVKGKEEASPEVAELIAACIGVLETVEIAVKVEIRREMAQWTEKVSQMTDATKSLEARANEIEAAAKRADEATMKLERASNEEVLETAAQKSEDVKVAVQEMCDDLIERVDVLSEKTENRFERMSRGAYVRIAKKVDRVEAFDAKLDSNMRDAQKQAYAMIKRHEALVKKGEQLLKIPRNFAAVVLMAALAGGALGATIFIAWETLFSKI